MKINVQKLVREIRKSIRELGPGCSDLTCIYASKDIEVQVRVTRYKPDFVGDVMPGIMEVSARGAANE